MKAVQVVWHYLAAEIAVEFAIEASGKLARPGSYATIVACITSRLACLHFPHCPHLPGKKGAFGHA